jgi:hypothetical protein
LSDIDLDVISDISDNGVMRVPVCEVCKRFLEEVGDILRRVFRRETNLDTFDLIDDGETSELEESCSRLVESVGRVLRDMFLEEINLEGMGKVADEGETRMLEENVTRTWTPILGTSYLGATATCVFRHTLATGSSGSSAPGTDICMHCRQGYRYL